MAAVLSDDPDSTDLHLADTLAAGAGLRDPDAVRVLVDEGPARVNELIALGAIFDRDSRGELLLARGRALARTRGARRRRRHRRRGGAGLGGRGPPTAAAVYEHWFALDLLIDGGRCGGVVALGPSGERAEVRAHHVLVATGEPASCSR